MLNLLYAAGTHQGRVRANNEDNFCVGSFYKQDTSQNEAYVNGIVRNGKLAVSVCDGMGGEELGEEASLIAVRNFVEMTENDSQLIHHNVEAFTNKANKEICARMQESQKRMGTTFTGLEFFKNKAVASNLGDSRIYLLRDGEIKQISYSHSTVASMIRMGLITPEAAKTHPKRHEITQYLGIFEEEMELEPFVSEELEIKKGDKFLLCSDGLTDVQTDEQIKEVLLSSEKPVQAVETLIARALEAGGPDNVTVIVVQAENKILGLI